VFGSHKGFKNNKAPGEDNISAELIKYGSLELWKEIHTLIEVIWINELIPEELHTAIICQIHKKGDKLQCSNYRSTSLLNVCYKILTNILHKRLEPYAEEILGDYQCGFRRGRSTTDQLFTLILVLEKAYEFGTDLHLFIDFKQAYDTVDIKYLFEVLKEFGIPTKLVNLIKMTLTDSSCRVKIQGQLSSNFKVKVGLRQGDALSNCYVWM
jgi:sorting nexin-29